MAAGVRPNIELAVSAGIAVNRGIIVNDYMQTSEPNVYAVGECAEHNGTVYGLAARFMSREMFSPNIFAAFYVRDIKAQHHLRL